MNNSMIPQGMYFDTNLDGLLASYIQNQLLGNNPNTQDYINSLTANVGYEGGGYGVDLGFNHPNPVYEGDILDWNVNIKVPINF